MIKNKVLLTLAPAALMAVTGLSQALPQVNDTDRASLLIFTDIDVRAGRSTLVQITNDAQAGVHLNCYWMDALKAKSRFDFDLSGNQTIVVNARTGKGAAQNFPAFPTKTGARRGELVCFAAQKVRAPGQTSPYLFPISWNYLIGKATVVNYNAATDGWAYEQAAWGIQAISPMGTVIGADDTLSLRGDEYAACPATLLGQFIPVGAGLNLDGTSPYPGNELEITQNKAVVVSCEQDLRTQGAAMLYTKLDFEIYDDDEDSLGYFQCADTWTEIYLGDEAAANPDWGGREEDAIANFTFDVLESTAGYYRVSAAPVDDAWAECGCNIVEPNGTVVCRRMREQYRQPGLTGSQATWGDVLSSDNLTAAGSNMHDQPESLNSQIRVTLYKAGSKE